MNDGSDLSAHSRLGETILNSDKSTRFYNALDYRIAIQRLNCPEVNNLA
jgi:hypothetical protein